MVSIDQQGDDFDLENYLEHLHTITEKRNLLADPTEPGNFPQPAPFRKLRITSPSLETKTDNTDLSHPKRSEATSIGELEKQLSSLLSATLAAPEKPDRQSRPEAEGDILTAALTRWELTVAGKAKGTVDSAAKAAESKVLRLWDKSKKSKNKTQSGGGQVKSKRTDRIKKKKSTKKRNKKRSADERVYMKAHRRLAAQLHMGVWDLPDRVLVAPPEGDTSKGLYTSKLTPGLEVLDVAAEKVIRCKPAISTGK